VATEGHPYIYGKGVNSDEAYSVNPTKGGHGGPPLHLRQGIKSDQA